MSIYRGRNCRDVYLASVLYDAIDDNNLKAVNMLLEKGSDPNLILPRKGISSFHRIIGCDSLDFTMKATCLVLQFGGNPNIKSDDGLTPLHIAAAWGRPEILQILLCCGGDPNAKDSNYLTPVDYAMKGESPECVYLLKSFLPVNNLLEKEQEDCCSVNLERVLVNNGFALGEYHILPEQQTDISEIDNLIKNNSRDNISEFVLNWFNKCESDIKHISSDNEISAHSVILRKPQRKPKEGSISINQENCAQEYVSKVEEIGSSKNFQDEKLSTESGIVVSSSELRTYSLDTRPICLNQIIECNNGLCDQLDNNSKYSDKSESSDYKTCSNSFLEKNIFEITEDLSYEIRNNELPSVNNMNESSFIAVSEIYKYEDKEEGVTLFEKRLVKTPSECDDSIRSASFSSKISSLPDTFDYDTDTLRMELTSHGFKPGPITKTTKKLYLKKLYRFKKQNPRPNLSNKDNIIIQQKIFSVELEKTRKKHECFQDLSFYKSLECVIVKEFSNSDPLKKWREGLSKSSFTYLLLDPRITKNLPYRVDYLEPKEIWDIFLSAVFYIGKGKKTRPYSHLYEAVSLWKTSKTVSESSKLKYILDIWKDNCGVICLHVFHNVIPVEAYTREAAMIAAMKIENLTNLKSGEFYGVAAAWPQRTKKSLGVYLLYKAMKILIQDGERQIYPRDID